MNLPENKQQFLDDLSDLKQRFEAMEPELVETIHDPDMGVEGYVVVWNTGISKGGKLELSGKGGTRVTPDLTIDEIKMLARTMALKNAAAGLPLGGAKSGLRADSSAEGFEQKYRRFVSLCKPLLFENGGVFGGFGFDIGARPEMPHWACDELGSLNSFTGKPVEMGGTDYDRQGIAGLGVAVAAKTMMACKGVKVGTFAVQGLGAMGAAVFRYFTEYGGSLKALGDPKYGGTWRFKNGVSEELKTALVEQDVTTARSLIEKEGFQISDSAEDVLYVDVDVLFPCAVQDVITDKNAEKVKVRFMVEGANQPTTAEGYSALFKQGVHIVPDFIANPGGVIAAYVELTSDVSAKENAKTMAKVNEAKDMTEQKISKNVRAMVDIMDRYDVSAVDAGTYLALSRIVNA